MFLHWLDAMLRSQIISMGFLMIFTVFLITRVRYAGFFVSTTRGDSRAGEHLDNCTFWEEESFFWLVSCLLSLPGHLYPGIICHPPYGPG